MESGPVVMVATRSRGRDNLMTISWTMVLDFDGGLAITTGAWNHSFAALRRKRECVIAIPGADLMKTAVDVGMCSGTDVDKFTKFHLTPKRASNVGAPLVAECLFNIECRVEAIHRNGIVVLRAVKAWQNTSRREKRVFHAVGDGTFVIDGPKVDLRRRMSAKIPPGV